MYFNWLSLLILTRNDKKCNLTLAMSPTCQSNSPMPIYWPYGILVISNRPNSSRDNDFFSSEFLYGDIQTSRQKATLKSPPCISTGGLKNCFSDQGNNSEPRFGRLTLLGPSHRGEAL